MFTHAANAMDRFGLAPPKMKPGFFIDYRKGEVGELRLLLRKMAMDTEYTSTSPAISGSSGILSLIVNPVETSGGANVSTRRRREILKKLIACMAMGIDCSRLYAEVVMVSHTNDPVQKKIIYLYLSTYSRDNPDLTVLTINTLLKDLDCFDPVIRCLAMRHLCALDTSLSNKYAKIAFSKKLYDPSDAVKRAAILGGIRLARAEHALASNGKIENENSGILQCIKVGLKSTNVDVVFDTMCAISEIVGGDGSNKIPLTRASIIALVNRLGNMTEWEQCAILELLATYEPVEDELFDLMNLLDSRLNQPNLAVFLATAKCFLIWTQNDDMLQNEVVKRIESPMISLMIKSRHELLYVLLQNALLLIVNVPQVNMDVNVKVCNYKKPFADHVNVFYCLYDDPVYIKRIKLSILLALANQANALALIHEFNEYISDSNYEVATRSIKALGLLAADFPEHFDLVLSMIAAVFTCQISHLTVALLMTIKGLLRVYPQHSSRLLDIVEAGRHAIVDSASLAHYIWILGEYGYNVDHAPYTLEDLVNDVIVKDDGIDSKVRHPDFVIEELVVACFKIFLRRTPEMFKALVRLLNGLLTECQNPQLANICNFYYALLQGNVEDANNIVFARDQNQENGESQTAENVNGKGNNHQILKTNEFYAEVDEWRQLFNSFTSFGTSDGYNANAAGVTCTVGYSADAYKSFFPYIYDPDIKSDIFSSTKEPTANPEASVCAIQVEAQDASVKSATGALPELSDYTQPIESILTRYEDLSLVHPATIYADEFQNRWFEAEHCTVLRERIENINEAFTVNLDALEIVSAKTHVITLASGKSDHTYKLYQYTEDSTGVVYFIETVLEPNESSLELATSVKTLVESPKSQQVCQMVIDVTLGLLKGFQS